MSKGRKLRSYRNIIVDGIHFKTISAAAKYFDVSYQIIWHYAKNDRLHCFGMGHKSHAKPIRFEGCFYPTREDLASTIGCTVKVLRKHIREGTLDLFVRSKREKFHLNGMPIRWRDRVFKTQGECAHQLGYNLSYINIEVNRTGNIDHIKPRINSPIYKAYRNAGVECDYNREYRIKVRWRNVVFETHSEASEKMGYCRRTITNRIDNGTLDELEPRTNSPMHQLLAK